jgi:hypothetical protein
VHKKHGLCGGGDPIIPITTTCIANGIIYGLPRIDHGNLFYSFDPLTQPFHLGYNYSYRSDK